MQNILSIDLEDWYQARSYRSKIEIKDWDRLESRLDQNTQEILNVLKAHHTKATFFVLAYNAGRHPDLIRSIVSESHEIGLHGFYHNLVYRQSPSEFKNELDDAKKLLEDVSGTRVIGFRAPSWSITRHSLWALDILLQSGFLYDSSMDESVFRHSKEKIPKGLQEFGRSSLRILNQSLPFAGGFFLRAYPYFLTRRLIQEKNKKGQRIVAYIHQWEMDESALEVRPYFPRSIIYNFRLNSTKGKLIALLRDFKFDSIKNIFFMGD